MHTRTPAEDLITLTIGSDAHSVMPLAAALSATLQQLRVTAADIAAVKLGTVEAVNNCIEHAYGQGGERGAISVHVRLCGERLELEVRDSGRPFQASAEATLPSLDSEDGRGCFIVNACFDTVDYCSDGGVNTLFLVKQVELAAASGN